MADRMELAGRSGPDEQVARPERELWVFLAAAFGVSWGVGVAGSVLLGPAAYLFGVFGPAIAALWVTRRYEGSVRSLWAHVVRWRLSWRWYLAALAIPLAILAAARVTVSLLGGSWQLDEAMPLPGAAAFLVFAFLVAGGPEELGWRGYALPRLQSRWDALTSSLILGVIWAFWHLPLWFMPDLLFEELNYPLYATQVVASCVIYTWLYNSTGGSVLLAMLLHASTNLSAVYLPAALQPQLALTVAWVAAAALIVVRFGPRDLARGARIDRDEARRRASATAGGDR
jgi:uncharacterized protein